MVSEAFGDKLYQFLATHRVRNGALVGPDPGVRLNYRFWRFAKSALRFIEWKDDLCYLQAQGYWVLANWQRCQTPTDVYETAALASTNQILQLQRADGAWDYPNREWRGRVATVEGIWASLALLESYQRTRNQRYLDSALRWNEFFETKIGFQNSDGGTAVNYFANEVSEPVPNNSALALRYLATFYKTTRDRDFLSRCNGLLQFIQRAQKSSGEVPYIVGDPKMEHFQCFQYHAFMWLDIHEYYRITRDENAIGVLEGLTTFLSRGLSDNGEAYYQCGNSHRRVNYHSAAVATALGCAAEQPWISNHTTLSSASLRSLSQRALDRLQTKQRPDGSLPHSRGDYRVLDDRRSYPRYLAMILYHWGLCEGRLLIESKSPVQQTEREPLQSMEATS